MKRRLAVMTLTMVPIVWHQREELRSALGRQLYVWGTWLEPELRFDNLYQTIAAAQAAQQTTSGNNVTAVWRMSPN